MYVVCRLPGSGLDLSYSIRDHILPQAESWAGELRRTPLPPFHDCKIRYRPEPADSLAEEWVDPYTVLERGYGDCDDLVIWRLAEILNENGYRPDQGRDALPAWPLVARIVGTGKYHVAIRHKNGKVEDPAKEMLDKYGSY